MCPVAAVVEEEDSVDVLELSGATTVLPLKHQLGEYLANRVDAGRLEAHVVGEFKGLQIAELPVRDTVFAGTTIRDTRLRQTTGLSVVGFWERGKLRPAYPDTAIQPDSVLVVAGTPAQIGALNALLPTAGGCVGASARHRRRQGRTGCSQGAQAEGPSRAPDRSNGGGARATGVRGRRRVRRRRLGSACAGARRYSRGPFRPADHQRRCDEHLSGGVLPAPERAAPNRQPDHARAESRSHPPGRRRLRARVTRRLASKR